MKKEISLIIPLGEGLRSDALDSVSDERIKVIIEKGENPSRNRNRGIKKAKTPIVAFTNGHASIYPDWAKNVINFFKRNPDIDIVGGPQHNAPDEGPFGRASGYAMASIFGSGGIWRRYGGSKEILEADETMLTSSNLACRKKVFKKVMFDESIYPGEDPKFISDSKAAGFRIAYSPEIKVCNRRRTGVLTLSKQIFNYGSVRPMKESLSETIKRPFFFVPSLFVIYLISLIFYNPIFYLFPIFLYAFLILFYSLYLPIKNNDIKSWEYLPFVFISIHISYGLGFIYGMLRKII